jgi:glutaredoxin 2
MLPVMAPKYTSKYLAAAFLENYDGSSPVHIVKFLRPGFAFYSGIYGREIPKKANLPEFARIRGAGYYIVRQKEYDNFSDELKKTMVLLQKTEDILILRKY